MLCFFLFVLTKFFWSELSGDKLLCPLIIKKYVYMEWNVWNLFISKFNQQMFGILNWSHCSLFAIENLFRYFLVWLEIVIVIAFFVTSLLLQLSKLTINITLKHFDDKKKTSITFKLITIVSFNFKITSIELDISNS